MRQLLMSLIQELNVVIDSGNLMPEDLTRLTNAKKAAEEALESYQLNEQKHVQLMIIQTIRLLMEFFKGD